jgi:hypothetical protein
MRRAHQDLLVTEAIRNGSKVGHGIGNEQVFRLRPVDRIAEAPSAQGLEAVPRPGTVLGVAAAQAGHAMPARGDGAGDDALALAIASHAGSELLDHADGLVSDRQPPRDGIFALQDVDVRSANRRGGHADQGVERPHVGHGFFIEGNPVGLDEYGSLHRPCHRCLHG